MTSDPHRARGALVGDQPTVLQSSQLELIETLYGDAGLDARIWCKSCHRVWRIRDMRLAWLDYFDEYGWYCPEDGDGNPMSYDRLRSESEQSWPTDPEPGQVFELSAQPPRASEAVFALMSEGKMPEAHNLYAAEANVGGELEQWGFQLAQEEWRRMFPTEAREQLLATPALLEEYLQILAPKNSDGSDAS